VRVPHDVARLPGDLGSAVRRLRERRPGCHRSVHLVWRGEVGTPVRPDTIPPARLRGPGTRALVRAARAVLAALRRAQHAGLRAVDARADVPLAQAPDAAPGAQTPHRADAEEPAASPPFGVVPRRA